MSAYLIGHIRILDNAKWEEYLSQVNGTIHRYGGEVLLRGLRSTVLGEADQWPRDYPRVVVLRFADSAALHRWHESVEYRNLLPLRTASADVTVISYEDDSEALRIAAGRQPGEAL
ncbi:MAG: DUF1330 domain-containing protein [Betaproteobacteria bacterium]|nr:DUF1330 domain-containing protein [Betaproteobacteria bacterium]